MARPWSFGLYFFGQEIVIVVHLSSFSTVPNKRLQRADDLEITINVSTKLLSVVSQKYRFLYPKKHKQRTPCKIFQNVWLIRQIVVQTNLAIRNPQIVP